MNLPNNLTWAKIKFDLAKLIKEAPQKFPIDAIYLFGSRRFNTLSLRSDIDIFFVTTGYIKPSDLRDYIDATCIALDIFTLDRGRATSVVNESFIQFDNDAGVLAATNALLLWSKSGGTSVDPSLKWIQEYADHVNFAKTVLPNLNIIESFERIRERLSQFGLPTDPIVGVDEEEIANKLIKIAHIVSEFQVSDFPGKGSSRQSFVIKPETEYDFQDLFWIATKPWVGGMIRENVEVVFDGQRKKSDFSVGNSRVILEMKFAKDQDDKREIVKTLDGLSNFYVENANVRLLLFIIYALPAANIDRALWESRYSKTFSGTRVLLSVIRVS